jgi:hypothetical protein
MTKHDGANASIAVNRLTIKVIEELRTDRNVCPTGRSFRFQGVSDIPVRDTLKEFFDRAGYPGQH